MHYFETTAKPGRKVPYRRMIAIYPPGKGQDGFLWNLAQHRGKNV